MSNTCFLKSGATYRVTSKRAMDLHDKLPAGNYVIKVDPRGELYLEAIEDFVIHTKLYGNVISQTGRILHTFADRPTSTGLMLAGEKGSGKTLLAKNVCVEASKLGMPTIVINAPWIGDQFSSLIQGIEQPCVILFDEFEKVYPQDKQPAILTLLDGVFPTKKLFILTCNDKWKVDFHMRNRPGRIYYMLDFDGLSDLFIEEYCKDNLKNQVHVEKVRRIATAFDRFNFDMLKALVEEMNRFNETPQEAITMLNAKPEFSNPSDFNIKILVNNREIPAELNATPSIRVNPLLASFHVEYWNIPEGWKAGDEVPDDLYESIPLGPKNLHTIDTKDGKFVFKHQDNVVIILDKVKTQTFNYFSSI